MARTPRVAPWVTDDNAALLTDLYQLTMVQAYWNEGMDGEAVFSLYYRNLPPGRSYALACGLEDALRYLETLRFGPEALDYLATQDRFTDDFLDWLGEMRFEGDVFAMPEGTPVFPEEPLLEVVAPIPVAQLAESFIMNQVHFQTVLASKASRIVQAARGRAVVDFGLRRMHGTDAALKGARAYHVAGLAGTSNVLAGHVYGLPITGTMAHSYVQSHDDELEAFRDFAALYPETILLVDTYDTLEGVEKVVELARELGDDFRVSGIRLDSGDLGDLATRCRKILDDAGLEDVDVVASGGLDEYGVDELVRSGAPIDGFGVGTAMGTSADAPSLDMAYKLTAYAGKGRLKLSPGKTILPGRKQVWRFEEDDRAVRDVIARADDAEHFGDRGGRPLLERVMEGGRRTRPEAEPRAYLDACRERATEELAKLPERLLSLEDADPPYPVEVSEALGRHQHDVIERVDHAG
jgi:nicotinate phosphoribosyltransferase